MFSRQFMVGGALILLALPAFGGTKKQKGPVVKVRVHGALEHPVVAIGAETTGTIINAAGITWELELTQDKKFLELAEKLNGKQAVVSGILERREGVEIKERWIVMVKTLEEAKNNANKQVIYVEASGKLEHGVVAIGGETTGTVVTSGRITLEVDLSRQQELIARAEELSGKFAMVTGKLELRKGVEIPRRLVVVAQKINEVKRSVGSAAAGPDRVDPFP